MARPARHSERRYDAFVSHSTRVSPQHEELLERLVSALGRRGLAVFWDRINLRPGDPLVATLESAISHTAVGLVIHTRRALESGWVELERGIMLRRRAAGKMGLLALKLEPECALLSGVRWDRVIEVQYPVDITRLANSVAEAVRALSEGQDR